MKLKDVPIDETMMEHVLLSRELGALTPHTGELEPTHEITVKLLAYLLDRAPRVHDERYVQVWRLPRLFEEDAHEIEFFEDELLEQIHRLLHVWVDLFLL